MLRRNFINLMPAMGIAGSANPLAGMNLKVEQSINPDSREYWISVLTKIADPLLNSLSNETLRKRMPVECSPGYRESRMEVTCLEAFGRLMAGTAPWLELGADNTSEGMLRTKYIELTRKCLSVSVNPDSGDYMNFTKGGQPNRKIFSLSKNTLTVLTGLISMRFSEKRVVIHYFYVA